MYKLMFLQCKSNMKHRSSLIDALHQFYIVLFDQRPASGTAVSQRVNTDCFRINAQKPGKEARYTLS